MRSLALALVAACGGTAVTDTPTDEATDTGFEVVPFVCDVDLSETWRPDDRVLRWPYFTSVTDTSAVVQFGLPPGEKGSIEWGTSDAFGTMATATVTEHDALTNPIAYHEVELTGLTPRTSYCFRVMLGDDDLTGPMAFTTAPPPSSKRAVKILVVGDYGNGSADAQAVLDAIEGRYGDFDLWVATGDNAYSDGTWDEWDDNVFRFYRNLLRRVPYFPVPGNHDYRDEDDGGNENIIPMLSSLALPRNAFLPQDQERYYSFDWGPVHFVMADSQLAVYQLTEAPDDDMADWMKADLTANADRPWKFGVWHHPAYLTQPGRGPEPGTKLILQPIAEEYGIDVVLNGHNHNYERFMDIVADTKVERGVSHIVTGGGGAGLYEVDDDSRTDRLYVRLREYGASRHHFVLLTVTGCKVEGEAIGTDGEAFDTWVIDRCSE